MIGLDWTGEGAVVYGSLSQFGGWRKQVERNGVVTLVPRHTPTGVVSAGETTAQHDGGSTVLVKATCR